MKLKDLKTNPKNPRYLTEADFQKLLNKILTFPRLLEKNKITFDSEQGNTILGGNMRFKALNYICDTYTRESIFDAIKTAQNSLNVDNADLIEESVTVFTRMIEKRSLPENWVQDARGLSEEEKQAFIVIDNVSDGKWDFDALANNWDIDFEAWGLVDWGNDTEAEDTDFDDEHLNAKEDDYQEPENLKVDVVLGDLIEIGQHRLLCGDSTNPDHVAKLMNNELADLGFNDPPYGMKKENEGILNDNLNYKDLLEFNKIWIPLQFSFLKDNGSWYCWGIDEPLMDVYSCIIKPYVSNQKATFRNLITWNKGHGQGQNAEGFRMYPIADEKCLFVMMGVQGFNNNADNYFEGWEPIRDYLREQRLKAGWDVPEMKRIAGHSDLSRDHWTSKSQWNMPTEKVYKTFQNYCKQNNIDAFKKEYDELKKEYDELKKEYDELKKEYYSTRAYFNNIHDNQNNVWHFERTKDRSQTGGHATPKPIPLCERAIKSSCPESGLVVDYFIGSGSTMVAAHQLNRKCYGMELEPKYCQVIINRMQKLDPSLIVKINGKEYKTETPF